MTDPARSPAAVILGYGPMVVLLVAGAAAWLLPHPWPFFAVQLGIWWGALVLAFMGGVRRGYGFVGEPPSRTSIVSAIVYFVLAGLALQIGRTSVGIAPLVLGYALVGVFDRRAALAGDAPAAFATLRPRQVGVALVGLVLLWAWTIAR